MLLPSFPGWPHTPGPGPESPGVAMAPTGAGEAELATSPEACPGLNGLN